MFPVEELKAGIEKGDWAMVCRGYQGLTGKAVEPPTLAAPSEQLVAKFRGRLNAVLDQLCGEMCPGPVSKAKPKIRVQPVIVVPTAEEAEAILSEEDGARIECASEPEPTDTEIEPDAIKPEDIDGEGPTEALKSAGTSAHKTVYNETMRFVSGNTGRGEVERNRRKAQATAQHKQVRPSPPVYEVECTKCGKTFQSPTKPNSHVGQKCARCIRNMERPEK